MRICGGVLNLLTFERDPDFDRMGAVGQIAVIVTLSHPDPTTACVKSRTGHEHEIKLLRHKETGTAQNRSPDAVCTNFPTVRHWDGGGQGEIFAADRIRDCRSG